MSTLEVHVAGKIISRRLILLLQSGYIRKFLPIHLRMMSHTQTLLTLLLVMIISSRSTVVVLRSSCRLRHAIWMILIMVNHSWAQVVSSPLVVTMHGQMRVDHGVALLLHLLLLMVPRVCTKLKSLTTLSQVYV